MEQNNTGATQKAREPIRVPFTSLYMPGFVSDQLYDLSDFGQRQRETVVYHMPDYIIQNSSNVMGVMELAAEAAVFKAANNDFIRPENRGKLAHYFFEPPYNIFRSITSKAKLNMTWSDALNPRYYKESFLEFSDLEKATARDLSRSGKLINRWQSRAMFSSIVGMTITAIVPHKKDDPDDAAQMSQMYRENPLQYVGTRLEQAVYLPGIGQHKAQFAGLGKTLAGLFTFLGSYRNVAQETRYFHNGAHGWAGLITAAGGLQLLLGVDSEASWKNYGAISWLRLGLVPKSIYNRYKEGDARAHWYAGSVGMFQVQNTLAYLIGGAEKDENGRLIDKKARRHSLMDMNEPSSTPSPLISSPANNNSRLKEESKELLQAS